MAEKKEKKEKPRESLEDLATEEGLKKGRPLTTKEMEELRDKQVKEKGSAPLGSEQLIQELKRKKKLREAMKKAK